MPEYRTASSPEQSRVPAQLRDWRSALERYRRMLFSVLAELAKKQGLVVTPQEGMDLIHDFFLDEWPGLRTRYRPERGKLDTYVYRAFLYFARPRIIRMRRWRAILKDAHDLSHLAASQPDDQAAEGELISILQRSLDELPGDVKAMLLLRLDGVSERKIAHRFKSTRYGVREKLAEGFGRLVVALGESQRFSTEEWRLALALWRDGRSRREAASGAGTDLATVDRLRDRVLRLLAKAIPARRGITDKGEDS